MRLNASLLIAMFCLAACANTGLRDLRQPGPGPDEFIIEPKKPLQTPQNLTALPQPTPGAANLTDNDPVGDAIVALGGRPNSGGGIPASDAALVGSATRFGVTPDIRQQLDETDAEFRRRQARLANIRIFPEDRYNQAYERESLNPTSTAEQWRRAGAQTPSYPPLN
ncbi:MAG: DUF3035 domain-containing protein [Pseudomonadota bacterium]